MKPYNYLINKTKTLARLCIIPSMLILFSVFPTAAQASCNPFLYIGVIPIRFNQQNYRIYRGRTLGRLNRLEATFLVANLQAIGFIIYQLSHNDFQLDAREVCFIRSLQDQQGRQIFVLLNNN